MTAFGQPVASTGSSTDPYEFAATSGYRNDGDAGLTLVGARYYDPQAGSFISRDTWLDELPFVYCDGNPVNAVDPSGHGMTSLDGNPEDVELAEECAEDIGGDSTNLPGDTTIYRGGGSNPGNLTPRPGTDDNGLSFNLQPRSGPNVWTTVRQAVNSGFKVLQDGADHVSVSVDNMEEWLGNRESQWTTTLKGIVQKL